MSRHRIYHRHAMVKHGKTPADKDRIRAAIAKRQRKADKRKRLNQ